MHLLATTSGVVDGAAEAADLDQTPADIVVLSAADSELAALARDCRRLGRLVFIHSLHVVQDDRDILHALSIHEHRAAYGHDELAVGVGFVARGQQRETRHDESTTNWQLKHDHSLPKLNGRMGNEKNGVGRRRHRSDWLVATRYRLGRNSPFCRVIRPAITSGATVSARN